MQLTLVEEVERILLASSSRVFQQNDIFLREKLFLSYRSKVFDREIRLNRLTAKLGLPARFPFI
jgi:hypothetical protein